MLLSSGKRRFRDGRFLVDGAVAKHGPKRTDSSSCEGNECLFVTLAFCTFAVIERPRRRTTFQAGQCREITGPQQAPIEAPGAMVVAADPTGITWCRGEARNAGEAIDGFERL